MKLQLPVWLVLPLLTGCVAAQAPVAGSTVELRLEPERSEVFNIVWLKATLTNKSPERIWVVAQNDSVDQHCRASYGIDLSGLTPKSDSVVFCQPCVAKDAAPRYAALAPGAQRTTHLRVDLNKLLPNAAIDKTRLGDEPCNKYINRTMGNYQFRVHYQSGPHPKRGRLGPVSGNTVTVYRKE